MEGPQRITGTDMLTFGEGRKTVTDLYREELARILEVDVRRVSLYWKGRVALFALLKAMNVGKGDEVLLPAYTCVVVPNAIMYLGAKPVYVDIERDTLCMNVSEIESRITPKTRVILAQNTFGLSAGVDDIARLGKKYGIHTIEDCTHGFGGAYNGTPNGTVCDAAFYSSQWNKPFSTGIGGISVVNNEDVLSNLDRVNSDLVSPGVYETINLAALQIFARHVLDTRLYWSLVDIYRKLSKTGFVVGSSSGPELEGIMPNKYFKGFSQIQAKEGVAQLRRFGRILGERKGVAARYGNALEERGKRCVPRCLYGNHSFLRYPVWLKDKKRFFDSARKARVKVGDWFMSPLHPVVNNLERWGFNEAEYPVAVHAARHVANLVPDVREESGTLALIESEASNIL